MIKKLAFLTALQIIFSFTATAITFQEMEGKPLLHPEGITQATQMIEEKYAEEIKGMEPVKAQIRFYFYSSETSDNGKGEQVYHVQKLDAETYDDLFSFDGWDEENPDTKKVKKKKAKKEKKKSEPLFQIFANDQVLSQLQELAEITFKREIERTCGKDYYLDKVRVRITYQDPNDSDGKKVKFNISPLREEATGDVKGAYTVNAKKVKLDD